MSLPTIARVLWGNCLKFGSSLSVGLAVCLMSMPAWSQSDHGQSHGVLGEIQTDHSSLHSKALQSRDKRRSKTLFEILSADRTGIDLFHRFPEEARFDLLTDQTSGSGVCIGDIDGDDLPDIYFTNYDRGNRLYRNLGDWRFADVTEAANVLGESRWCGGASFIDIDNDGDLDLFVCAYDAPNLLYINRGHGVFDEKAGEFGLDFSGASVMMAFADYDLDGDLDGYLVTHRLKTGKNHLLPKTSREAFDRGIIHVSRDRQASISKAFQGLFGLMDKGDRRTELIIAGQQDVLYRNEGNGKFRIVNEGAGIQGFGIGLAAIWWDYNHDGYPDLYVSNDYKGPDQLYRNNGNGTFTDVARSVLPHVPWFSMGVDIGDINNDGRMDLLASDMSGMNHFKQKMGMGNMEKSRWFLIRSNPQQYMRNALFLNTGTERFMEVAHLTGLANTDWTWSPKFGDLNNDGWLDLFVSNGMSRDFMNSDLANQIKDRGSLKWRETAVLRQNNVAFRNAGELGFENTSSEWGLDQLSASYGAALADMDRDGDLDLIVTNFDEAVSVYRNAGDSGHSILIRLKGNRSNTWGIGAEVTLRSATGTQIRQLTSCQGFMSANEPLIHFGLNEFDRVEELTIDWPSGIRQTLSNLQSGRLYTITEPAQENSVARLNAPREPYFEPTEIASDLSHRERIYDDYEHQPLLPAKQSQLGPGLALGDVDNDGREDLFLGGAAGFPGTVLLRTTPPRAVTAPFLADAECEDMGALFFDADGDGDLDLYVVSGGVEHELGHESLRDRLYFNRGDGSFFRAPSRVLPDFTDSGSTVTATDYDRDGDLDLFIGGRSIPGRYPLASENYLLKNTGGQFTIVTDSDAPGLRTSGIVTSALWSDADNDGWIDLLVTHEWGPVKLFRNRKGRLVDETVDGGLAQHTGWWNGISGGDVDHDGDIDYVVTNVGLNTKYHGSPGKPVTLYYGDVDGSGVMRLVEANYEGEICYPVRGRSCSIAAIPSLRERFSNFEQFALASVTELFSPNRLESTLRLEATMLESSILINDGKARFTIRPLPRMAQAAPSYGSALIDFDGDGDLDLYLVQNSFSPEPETGRMDGGVSLLLEGDGTGNFKVIPSDRSGLTVAGDAKALSVTDLNGDGWPDFVIGLNNAAIRAFQNSGSTRNRILKIHLIGKSGNPTAVGARVTVILSDQSTRTVEAYSGGGYLSQSTAVLYIGLGPEKRVSDISVRWPDGRTTKPALEFVDDHSLTAVQPE